MEIEQIKRHCVLCKYEVWSMNNEQWVKIHYIYDCLFECKFEVVSLLLRHTIQFRLSVFFRISLLWEMSPFMCYSELKGFGGELEQTQPLDCLNWWYTQASVAMIALNEVPETDSTHTHTQREREFREKDSGLVQMNTKPKLPWKNASLSQGKTTLVEALF